MEEAESEQFGRIVRALATCGINFPGDFEPAPSLRNPSNMFTEANEPDATLEVFIWSR